MSQIPLLVDVLKRSLRQRGLTYARVARELGLSEASVKRLFAQRSFSLQRLEQVCALVKLEIADLLELTRAAEGRVAELTEEQERELAANPKLLLVGILALNHWTVAKMVATYRLNQTEVIRLLVRLDKFGVIDLLPDNRIRVRLARTFAWRKEGPLKRFFEERVQRQFFESSFVGEQELRLNVNGSLSPRSNEVLQQRMRKLAEEFEALVEEDRQLDYSMRSGTTLVMAIRPWELSLFTELRREPEAGAGQGAAMKGTASAPPVREVKGRR